jgi:hypothetical protein
MIKAWVFFLPVLLLSACCPAPTIYPRMIIDTYRTTGPSTVNTFISLFNSAGDPTSDSSPNLWNNDDPPYTVDAPPLSIAEDDNGNLFYDGYARIDYTGGLTAGTYYIRVRAGLSNQFGPYSIRILTLPDDIYTSWLFTVSGDDALYEPDDSPQSGGIPIDPVPIAIGEKLNRFLTSGGGDVDWFVLTLP